MKNKKKLFFIIAIIFVLTCVAIFFKSRFMSNKINSLFFSPKVIESTNLTSSFNSTKIQSQKGSVNLYSIINPNAKINIFYVAGSSGFINNVLNSSINQYNVFILDYPKDAQLQNFKNLNEFLKLAFEEIQKTGVKAEDTIIFGDNIGGNLALSYSSTHNFKAVLLLNILPNERSYCKAKIKSIFCNFVQSSFSLEEINENAIYYFFNHGVVDLDYNYLIFNLINAEDKTLFEISGDGNNFNFNQILDFYNNTFVEERVFNRNQNQNEEIEDENLIDVDGLLNPDDYVD
jgi:hypothetical protein